jgi:hypothetical protein
MIQGRRDEARLRVATRGPFKHGKSARTNASLDAPIAPSEEPA